MAHTPNAAAQNRRRFIRATPEPGAPVRVDINGEGFIEVLHAVDISENGIHLKIAHRFSGCNMDEPASFVIHLPEPINKYFRAEGRIKHVHNDSFGVRFTSINEQSRALVRRYIAQWLKKRGLWDYCRYVLGLLR